MTETLRERVQRRLDELGINPFEAARRGQLERGYVNDIVKGNKQTVRGDNLAKLAKALDWTPADLVDAPEPRKPRGHGLNETIELPVRFKVAAGAWLAVDDVRDEPIGIYPTAVRVPGYEGFEQWIELVEGDSYNMKIPDGAYVHVVDAIALGYAPRHGDTVVVVRSRAQGSFIERSLKEVVQTVEGVELWPRSYNPRWDSAISYTDGVKDGEDVEVVVVGKVVRAYINFDPR